MLGPQLRQHKFSSCGRQAMVLSETDGALMQVMLAGLVPPAAAVAILGKFKAILIVIIVLMAIT